MNIYSVLSIFLVLAVQHDFGVRTVTGTELTASEVTSVYNVVYGAYQSIENKIVASVYGYSGLGDWPTKMPKNQPCDLEYMVNWVREGAKKLITTGLGTPEDSQGTELTASEVTSVYDAVCVAYQLIERRIVNAQFAYSSRLGFWSRKIRRNQACDLEPMVNWVREGAEISMTTGLKIPQGGQGTELTASEVASVYDAVYGAYQLIENKIVKAKYGYSSRLGDWSTKMPKNQALDLENVVEWLKEGAENLNTIDLKIPKQMIGTELNASEVTSVYDAVCGLYQWIDEMMSIIDTDGYSSRLGDWSTRMPKNQACDLEKMVNWVREGAEVLIPKNLFVLQESSLVKIDEVERTISSILGANSAAKINDILDQLKFSLSHRNRKLRSTIY